MNEKDHAMSLRKLLALGLVVLYCCGTAAAGSDPLAASFRNPPDSAKPWTYWFWINGNITREGITADLEAMAQAGIHGVLIMEVARPKMMAPNGPVAFGTPAWRELFRHAVSEAGRLGMEVNMNNDAGWTGSGGPWITPEYSMQKLVSTSLAVGGPGRCGEVMSMPVAVQNFYRDLRVLAYPASSAPGEAVAPERIVDLTARMNPEGRLDWEVPAGSWVVRRIGHTSTGQRNLPAPEAGLGLECDKLSAEGIRRHFEGFLGKLREELGPETARTLSFTHIDSWEVGGQSWTARMAEEFSRRRGYDLTPYLIPLAGGPAVGSEDRTRRFLRDFKRTKTELLNENYAAALRELANRQGMRLSIEAYGPSGDFIHPLDYAAEADLPMAEFWVGRWGAWHLLSARLISSAAHAVGRTVVGAESFTSLGENDSFTEHPYSIKAVGDWAFSEGINRFIFHRTVLQPWAGNEPGMSFGPYGTHFDRNQTWWGQGKAFMEYLARCQYLLQKGRFVGDIGRLVPDAENHGFKPGMGALPARFPALPDGYNYDYLSDKLLLGQAVVSEGRIRLTSGMSYRILQLPDDRAMTPELLRKIRDLVRAGAMVSGPRPESSPSLQNHPRCDEEVRSLAAELWGPCDGRTVTEHRLGAGRVFWGKPMAEVLREAGLEPDLQWKLDPPPTEEAVRSITVGWGKPMGDEPALPMPTRGINWIHRRDGETEIYFLANPQHRAVDAWCRFRVAGRQPELWDPATGEITRPAAFQVREGATDLPIRFAPAGSLLVLFREPIRPQARLAGLKRDGTVLLARGEVQGSILPDIRVGDTRVELETALPGRYEMEFADGQARIVTVDAPRAAAMIGGPWRVGFPDGRGAPASEEFPALVDWSRHEKEGIRYFSGTAKYATEFSWEPPPAGRPAESKPEARFLLDLGRVEVIAEVQLNGTDLGVLWKPPFVVDATRALKAGTNRLEVKVTNLWPNRLIGDERFPDDCTPGGTWKTGPIPAWPEWFLQGRPRPEPRRQTFTTWKYYTADSPLLPSGLLGPVTLQMSWRLGVR